MGGLGSELAPLGEQILGLAELQLGVRIRTVGTVVSAHDLVHLFLERHALQVLEIRVVVRELRPFLLVSGGPPREVFLATLQPARFHEAENAVADAGKDDHAVELPSRLVAELEQGDDAEEHDGDLDEPRRRPKAPVQFPFPMEKVHTEAEQEAGDDRENVRIDGPEQNHENPLKVRYDILACARFLNMIALYSYIVNIYALRAFLAFQESMLA
jgi:hypothetical protein